MTPVAPRVVNNGSYVSRINHVRAIFLWQAQYLVKFNCHLSWQVQHLGKFGMIAGAPTVVFSNTKCLWGARKVTSVARRVADGRFCGRIMVGSCSFTVHLFSRNFFEILESHFSWQAQYLVMLEGNLCCSAHCK